MSDNINQNVANLLSITAPSLNDANYGTQLKEVFSNINKNFAKLSHVDFVKGETGNSVTIEPVEMSTLTDDGTMNLTVWGEKLLNCINPSNETGGSYEPIKIGDRTITWDEYMYDPTMENNVLYLVCGKDGNSDDVIPYKSLCYTFIDARFAADGMGQIPDDEYEGRTDKSCIAVYDGASDKFIIYNNAFPTMYYEPNVGLCWKINGAKTSMPVRGIPGHDGVNGKLNIVKGQLDTSDATGKRYKITHIFDKDEYIEIDNFNVEDFDGQAAVILANLVRQVQNGSGETTEIADNNFYFGKLYAGIDAQNNNSSYLYTLCTPDNAINLEFSFNEFYNTLKHIDIYSSSVSNTLKGLFIPIDIYDKTNPDATQAVHLLTASDSTIVDAGAADDDTRQDLILAPISDINNFDKDSEIINTERYLYLRYNTSEVALELSDVTTSIKNEYDTFVNNSTAAAWRDKYNFILKYELFKAITKKEFQEAEEGSTVSLSKVYGSEMENCKYVIDNNGSFSFVESDYDTLPEEFKDRLNNNCIYVWQRTNEKHTKFDVDEIDASYSAGIPDNTMKYIYTTSSSPGLNSKFIWFNALDNKRYDYTNDEGIEIPEIIARGWDATKLDFVKFVPVNNLKDQTYLNDTSFTINYDVNITGDLNEPHKTLTVSGDINCDNINVYKLSAASEIQNIYTNDDIVGAKGIKLGKSVNDNDYLFKVDNGDILKVNNISSSGLLECDAITTKSISSNSIATKDLDIINTNKSSDKSKDILINLSINEKSGDDFVAKGIIDSLNINMDAVQRINIVKPKLGAEGPSGYSEAAVRNYWASSSVHKQSDYVNLIPAVVTDLPFIMNNNANLSITDTNDLTRVWADRTPLKLRWNKLINTTNNDAEKNKMTFNATKNYFLLKAAEKTTNTSNTKSVTAIAPKHGTNSSTSSSSYSNFGTYIENNTDSWRKSASLEYNISGNNASSNHALAKFKITKDANSTLDRSNITMTLGSYTFMIGVWGRCHYGNWPYLESASYVKLHVYANNDKGTGWVKLYTSSSYTFSGAGSSNVWKGYSMSNTTKLISDYGGQWRYYSYNLNPSNITLSASNISKLVDMYNLSETQYVELYVVPEVCIKIKGDNKCFKSIKTFGFVPKNVSTKANSSIISRNTSLYKQTSIGTYIKETATYAISVSNNDTSIKPSITSICPDGIVFTVNDYIFGIGYCDNYINHKTNSAGYTKYSDYDVWSNDSTKWSQVQTSKTSQGPILFYQKLNNYHHNFINEKIINDNSVSPASANGEKTIYTRFNSVINAVSLEDIFEAVKHIRTTSTGSWKQFGL